MATLPVVLVNGTTADANDVMDDFDEIYDNIDSSNVQSSNKTGTGKFALQTSPSINSPTLASPSVSGDLIINGGGDLKIYSDATTTLKFQVDGATGDFGITATRKFYLDGAALSGDTYLTESGANVCELVVGAESALRATRSTRLLEVNQSTWSFAIPSGQKSYLDSGGDTYFTESSANVLEMFVGAESVLRATRSTRLLEINESTWSFAVPSTRLIYFDGGSDTGLSETSANVLTVTSGGTASLAIRSSSIAIPSASRIYLDGVGASGDTYIYEAPSNHVNFFVGGSNVLELIASGASASQTQVFILAQTSGGADTSYRILLGAADSGGSGFRMMRITN